MQIILLAPHTQKERTPSGIIIARAVSRIFGKIKKINKVKKNTEKCSFCCIFILYCNILLIVVELSYKDLEAKYCEEKICKVLGDLGAV